MNGPKNLNILVVDLQVSTENHSGDGNNEWVSVTGLGE
jgi:hypothetical protein